MLVTLKHVPNVNVQNGHILAAVITVMAHVYAKQTIPMHLSVINVPMDIMTIQNVLDVLAIEMVQLEKNVYLKEVQRVYVNPNSLDQIVHSVPKDTSDSPIVSHVSVNLWALFRRFVIKRMENVNVSSCKKFPLVTWLPCCDNEWNFSSLSFRMKS